MSIGDFLKPNKLKIILAITMAIPSILLLSFFAGLFRFFLLGSFPLAVIFGLAASYILACTVDTFIKNTAVKIAIASLSALISFWISYLIIRSMTMICDPVHDPGICDPVHMPSSCETSCENIYNEAANITEVVRQKYSECISNCLK